MKVLVSSTLCVCLMMVFLDSQACSAQGPPPPQGNITHTITGGSGDVLPGGDIYWFVQASYSTPNDPALVVNGINQVEFDLSADVYAVRQVLILGVIALLPAEQLDGVSAGVSQVGPNESGLYSVSGQFAVPANPPVGYVVFATASHKIGVGTFQDDDTATFLVP